MDLDGLGIDIEALFLIDQEFFNVLALIALKLDHLAHLLIVDNGAIAGKLLLDDLEDLLLVKLLGQALHGGQGFAAIAFCIVRRRSEMRPRRGRDRRKDSRWMRMWM